MKTSINFCLGLTLTTTLLLATTGCDRFENQIQPLDPASGARVGGIGDLANAGFNAATFAAKIEARLTGKVPGFGYRIWVNGQPYGSGAGGAGHARTALDAPLRHYTSAVRQDIGSCSKLMTALLVLKVLERNHKTMEEPVWPYCPAFFKPSAGFKKLTFRDLLAHTSGVIKYGNYPGDTKGELADVQDSYENGILGAGDFQGQILNGPLPTKPYGQYAYNNMNYAICRIAVPYLIGMLENPRLLNTLRSYEKNYDQINEGVASIFRTYLRTEVFRPAGLNAYNQVDFTNWGSPASQFTKYYSQKAPKAPDLDNENESWQPGLNFADANQPGTDGGNYFLSSGSGGLFLSADELAQVVAAARANKIVNENVQGWMKTGDSKGRKMGFDGGMAGKHGTYYYKNGSGSGGNAVLLDFDGGPLVNVQVAITTNTRGTEVLSVGVWAKLFDESWK